jgi:hypothetical protein
MWIQALEKEGAHLRAGSADTAMRAERQASCRIHLTAGSATDGRGPGEEGVSAHTTWIQKIVEAAIILPATLEEAGADAAAVTLEFVSTVQ